MEKKKKETSPLLPLKKPGQEFFITVALSAFAEQPPLIGLQRRCADEKAAEMEGWQVMLRRMREEGFAEEDSEHFESVEALKKYLVTGRMTECDGGWVEVVPLVQFEQEARSDDGFEINLDGRKRMQ